MRQKSLKDRELGLWNTTKKFDFPSKSTLAKDGCFSRIPHSSLAAFTLCFIGVVLFTLMMIWSFNATVEQARRILNITDIPWLDKIHILFFITAFLMVVVAFSLLSIGILSTGSTREEVYKRASAQRGGRIMCIVAIILSYFLNILWILLVALTAIFSFIYFVFTQLCAFLPSYSDKKCLDFSVFKPFVSDFSEASLILCSGNAQQFCALTNTVMIWYAVGFLSSFLVCLGLLQFVASNAANYAHISNERRLSELYEILLKETSSPINLTSSNSNMYGGGKSSTSKLMDFQVDSYPLHQQQQCFFQPSNNNNFNSCMGSPFTNQLSQQYNYNPQINHGAFSIENSPRELQNNSVLMRAHNFSGGHLDQAAAGLRLNNGVAARRNSYHNSLQKGCDYNGFVNMMH